MFVADRLPASNLCGVGWQMTYGAVMESNFLLRMGSDMLKDLCRCWERAVLLREESGCWWEPQALKYAEMFGG